MAISTAAALLGSAVIGAGASAVVSGNAAKSAARTSQNATDATLAFNNRALDLQQQNTQPYRDAGTVGVQALLQNLGLVPAQAQATGPVPDYNAVLAERPDVAAAVNDPNGGFNGATVQERVADWYQRYGKDSGYQLPTIKPATPEPQAQPTPAAPQGNVVPVGSDPTRPGVTQVDNYQAPTMTQTPAYSVSDFMRAASYSAPETAPLDVSLQRYEKSPGYNFQQSEAQRATLAGSAATGALRSGAAAKALQDRAQQIANLDYNNWRDYTTGQYNTDRSRADQNAQFGYNALLGQNASQNAFNTNNSQFGYNALTNQNRFLDSAAIDAAQFGYNAKTQQNNLNNQFNQQAFNTDRAFTADQKQQGTNNLFNLAGMGASAAGSSNAAIGANAANNSNALFSNAATQGNAALASAGQVNNAINTGTNALTWYLGNRQTTPTSSGVYGPMA